MSNLEKEKPNRESEQLVDAQLKELRDQVRKLKDQLLTIVDKFSSYEPLIKQIEMSLPDDQGERERLTIESAKLQSLIDEIKIGHSFHEIPPPTKGAKKPSLNFYDRDFS